MSTEDDGMNFQEQKVDWLYRLKRRILFSILGVLTVAIAVTMIFIAVKLHDTLVNDSKVKTKELAVTIDSNLHHLMILRAPDAIQNTLEKIVTENDAITKVFILNNRGEIAYSSEKESIGTFVDKYEDESCHGCHTLAGVAPETDAVLLSANKETHRNISLIYNEKDCYECHDSSASVNGKLIIDRSLESTFALISGIQIILIGSGFISLLVLVPLCSRLLSRGVDQYIVEIFSRNEELRLLYVMVERLSKTLDLGLLKEIVVEIFKDILDAEEVELILAKGENDYSASVWTNVSGKIERCKVEGDKTLNQRLQAWLDDELTDDTVAEDGRELCMPIRKGSHRLALIVARRKSGHFDGARLKLSNLIGNHIAVAFDNARLYYIAITDELTKTFTKRHFRTCIDQTYADHQKYGNRFALLMMDLDKFKQVNDTYGHVVGDAVLQSLGEILRQSVRENDLVFRYGGEEFAVILPETDVKGALFVAERIRTTTEAAVFESGTIDLKLTLSIGISTCPEASTIRDLIVSADEALYEAKRQGRNQVVVSDKVYPEQEP